MSTATEQQRIIVGVDGSPRSARALEWALEEARFRSARLKVIYAFPALVSLFGTTAHEYYPQVAKEGQENLEAFMASAPSTEGVDVEHEAVPGNPSEVLVDASAGASLLVVGSRGAGNLRGLVLGSVSTHCAQLAHCPVVVVRTDED